MPASGAKRRTLDDDVIDDATFANLDYFANELFEDIVYYNTIKPHQALGVKTPKDFAAEKSNKPQSANSRTSTAMTDKKERQRDATSPWRH